MIAYRLGRGAKHPTHTIPIPTLLLLLTGIGLWLSFYLWPDMWVEFSGKLTILIREVL